MKKRTTYHHGDLRNALIQAALALIAEHGVEGFTLRDCAKKAGVSVAAPYRHFKDRDDLLAAVAADCMQRLGDAMDRAIEAAGDVDPLSVFRATGIAYVRFAVEHPAHFRVMYLPQVMARMPADVVGAFAQWGQDMAAKLAAAQRDGMLADLPLDQIMLAASCITHGLAHMIIDDVDGLGSLDPDAAAKLAVDVTAVLGYGLLPRAQPAAVVVPAPPKAPSRAKSKRARGAGAVLALIGLAGGGRAIAKPTPKPTPTIVAGVATYPLAEFVPPATPDDPTLVIVDDLPVKLPDGAYALVGTQGPVGLLSLDAIAKHQGGCPYQATFHLTGAPAWTPGSGDHLVVIGPLDPASTARPRLMLLGLALAGHAAAEPEESLGVDPPPKVVPTFAIDLDSDGAADLILVSTHDEGRFVHGFAKVKLSSALWTRAGARWTRAARCAWTTTDTIE